MPGVIHQKTIDHEGNMRPLGLIPGKPQLKWTEYGSSGSNTPKIVERKEWKERLDEMNQGLHGRELLDSCPYAQYVHDQDGIGQCNPEGTTAMIEALRDVQGLPFVKLSPGDLYGRINSGQDNGSLLEHALDEMKRNGVGTEETCGLLWNPNMTYASKEERARFKVDEFYLCPTFEHLMSATFEGFFGVSGIWWYDNYATVDSKGWLSSQRLGQFGGHAFLKLIVADYVEFAPGKYEYAIGHQNSWKKTYGHNGRFFVPETAFYANRYGNIGGWWVCRSATHEGGSIPPIKDEE